MFHATDYHIHIKYKRSNVSQRIDKILIYYARVTVYKWKKCKNVSYVWVVLNISYCLTLVYL